jgi:uncharacterized protein
MLIGIISDTHDHMDNVRKAIKIFQEKGVERVYHGGDIVSPSVVKLFDGMDLSIVFGNNDGEKRVLPVVVEKIDGKLGHEVLVDECEEGKIVLYHGTAPIFLNALIRCGDYRVVITGHSHKVVNRLEGNTRILNPGTGHGFKEKGTIMVYDTTLDQAQLIEL